MLERIVQKYLEDKNIEFEKQKRFNDCRNKRALPFDFYLPKYNCVIEVNGSQHYYENDWFSQSLCERQNIDNLKKQYCINNDIVFLELPFWYIKNNNHIKEKYKEEIDNIINQK